MRHLCIAVLLALASPLHAQRTAREIVDHVDRLLRGNSSRGEITMEVVTAHWQRSMTLAVWSLGTEYALIRIDAPPKDAGTATLKSGTEIWNYLPRVDRVIKLPSSLMGQAWMGSHFTNDDLVKESRIIEDYEIAIGFDGMRDGVRVWEFVLTPKPEAAVIWGRITEEVRQDDMMPTWARYYDERGDLVREITFSEYQRMGGRLVPAVMTVVPTDKPNERTVIRYVRLAFDVGLEPSFFSLRRLRSGAE
ncbi:MAG: outer membrane lipoprotein-sorting protein [Gemmatimonadota bacterium]|nr:outer membrane lipoprotein-sorting protein [Gemmatimonadota bacterium]